MNEYERPEWMDDGLCSTGSGSVGDLFFPGRGQSTKPAKDICARCSVKDECLEYALDEMIKFGIWGGLSERERRAERRRRAAIAASEVA